VKAGLGMRRILASAAAMLAVLASGIVASTSIGVSTAGAAEHASKTAFCGANDSIDRASANVDSNSGFLAVIKKHSHDLAVMKENAPPGAVGQLVIEVVNGADAAVSANNAKDLNNLPNGAAIDTYCGVNGNGKPLPAYFGKGTATAFCSNFIPIYQGASNATNQAGVLAVLAAHQSQLNQLALELSTLPKSIKTKATAAVNNAQAAIKANNPAKLGNGKGNGPAASVALYCGQNQ